MSMQNFSSEAGDTFSAITQLKETTTPTLVQAKDILKLVKESKIHDGFAGISESPLLSLKVSTAADNSECSSGKLVVPIPVTNDISDSPRVLEKSALQSSDRQGDYKNEDQGVSEKTTKNETVRVASTDECHHHYQWILAYGNSRVTKTEKLLGVAAVNIHSRSSELVVDPNERRRSVGTAIFERLRQIVRGVPRVWAHGKIREAMNFAERHNLDVVRQLHVMERDLTREDLDPVRFSKDLSVRQIENNLTDTQAWLDINKRAFKYHPEQGKITVRDLEIRRSMSWFRPEQFVFLEKDGRVVGYAWNKIEQTHNAQHLDGEIYAIGIDPAYQGNGYGSLLAKWAIASLAQAGCAKVFLYVDGTNSVAIRAYERIGLRIVSTDVQII